MDVILFYVNLYLEALIIIIRHPVIKNDAFYILVD